MPHSRTVIVIIVLACMPDAAVAQDTSRDATRPGRFFVGGALVLSAAGGAEQDPDGAGYIEPNFHGSLDWPALGATFNGGVFIGGSWSVGGEVSVRRERSAQMLESGRYKFESWETSSRYTDRELLVSALLARRFALGRSASVQAIGGGTISRSRQIVTERFRTYRWYGGTISSNPEDREIRSTDRGVVGGADVVFPTGRPVSVTCGARLHWLARPDYERRERIAPRKDPLVWHVSAGLRWRP